MPSGKYERKEGVKYGPAKGKKQIKTGSRPKIRRIRTGSALPSLKECSTMTYKVVTEKRSGYNSDEYLDVMER